MDLDYTPRARAASTSAERSRGLGRGHRQAAFVEGAQGLGQEGAFAGDAARAYLVVEGEGLDLGAGGVGRNVGGGVGRDGEAAVAEDGAAVEVAGDKVVHAAGLGRAGGDELGDDLLIRASGTVGEGRDGR